MIKGNIHSIENSKEKKMDIHEKYKIIKINNKRYYVFDMTEKLPILDETVPYLFRYDDIKIMVSSWNRMTIKILEEIDKRAPKSREELLALNYEWSSQKPFSETKKTNFTPFRDLYLNTNWTSTHAMMNIQLLLRAYNIDLSKCYFLIKKHFVYEPDEVKEYIRDETKKEFARYLEITGKEEAKIDVIIKNFDTINKILAKVSSGYNDFFLFDDVGYFKNYREKVIESTKKVFGKDDRRVKMITTCLDYLTDFYSDRAFYQWLFANTIDSSFIESLREELNNLFRTLKINIILAKKLLARMKVLYKKEIAQLFPWNTPDGLFKICKLYLKEFYYLNPPYISTQYLKIKDSRAVLFKYIYQRDEFDFSEMFDFLNKMQINKSQFSLIEIIDECSEDYVQVDLEKMVSKDKMNISEEMIKDIKKNLKFYINSFGKIESTKYYDYDSFPKCEYEWNKYFLLGFVRSFLEDDFKIIYLSKNIKHLEFVIDKNDN